MNLDNKTVDDITPDRKCDTQSRYNSVIYDFTESNGRHIAMRDCVRECRECLAVSQTKSQIRNFPSRPIKASSKLGRRARSRARLCLTGYSSEYCYESQTETTEDLLALQSYVPRQPSVSDTGNSSRTDGTDQVVPFANGEARV